LRVYKRVDKRAKKRVKLTDTDNYGFSHNDLLDVAAIVLSGQQFEKFQECMIMTNRKFISRTTYYRYLPIIEKAIEELWKEEQKRLEKIVRKR
jgi:hypothetical protein